ncbi:MAG: hypothetical protein ACUVTL_07130 [Thermoproteota archaeon]
MDGVTINFPRVSPAERITERLMEHLLASYYGINSFDASERYLLVLETDIWSHNPTKEDIAVLGVLDLKTRAFLPIAKTRSWNFQQGCMAHWLGREADLRIIYNDIRKGRFVSIILDLSSKEERVIDRPVSAVSSDGDKALSINFARLRITRPDYGYDGEGVDPREDESFPEDDGLFLIDLRSGKYELIVSIADAKEYLGIPSNVKENPLMWFNHTLFNKDGSRIFFLVRIQKKDGWHHTASMTVNPDGSRLHAVFPSPWNWGGSHYDWLSNDQLMVTASYRGNRYVPLLFTDGKEDYRILGKGILGDGHGTFSPDGRLMVIDTYPDSFRNQYLLLMDVSTDAILPLGGYYEPPRFFNPEIREHWRCDLHPRWSPKGDMIAFNSTHEDTRQV